MWFSFAGLCGKWAQIAKGKKRPRGIEFRPEVKLLEERTVPSTVIHVLPPPPAQQVDATDLRNAIVNTVDVVPDTDYTIDLAPGAYTLYNGELPITNAPTGSITFQPDPTKPPGTVTIDAEGGGRAFDISDAGRSTPLNVTFSGITIQNGAITGDPTTGGNGQGGAVRFVGSVAGDQLSFTNSVIQDSVANGVNGGAGQGGAIFTQDVGLSITNSQMPYNSANGGSDATGGAGQGGVIYASGGTVTISGANITHNTANGGGGSAAGPAQGGAIYADDSALTITGGSGFGYNATAGGAGDTAGGAGQGGVIFAAGGSVSISGGPFYDNIALGGGVADPAASNSAGEGDGGAIVAQNSVVSISDANIYSNTVTGGSGAQDGADAKGGAVDTAGGSLTISGAAIFQNTATAGGPYQRPGGVGGSAYGGGVYASGGTITIQSGAQFQLNQAEGFGSSSIGAADMNGGDAIGGGVYFDGLSTSFIGAAIEANYVMAGDAVTGTDGGVAQPGLADGAGVFVGDTYSGATFSMTDCRVDDNIAFGGSASANVANSTAYGGAATNGGLDVLLDLATIMYSSITDNSAKGGGAGAVAGATAYGGPATAGGVTAAAMYDVTVGDNIARGGDAGGSDTSMAGPASGGGVGARADGTHIYNSTVAHNQSIGGANPDNSQAAAQAGGIDGGGTNNTTAIYSTIVSNNSVTPAGTNDGPDIFGGTTLGYNLIYVADGSDPNFTSNPTANHDLVGSATTPLDPRISSILIQVGGPTPTYAYFP